MSGSAQKKQYTSPGDPRVIGSAASAANDPFSYIDTDGGADYASSV